jgi:intein-encoded DNA endonuclease-like protein
MVIKKFDSTKTPCGDFDYDSLIKKRIFIVGCPRSGTTLLQGMLAAHSDIYSIPETFFFSRAFISNNPLKRYLLWPAIKVRKHFKNLVFDTDKSLSKKFSIGMFQSDYYRPFVDFMDYIALKNRKNSWIEKTPMHLYCIDEIQSKIPDAYIIHVVRNGLDVVESLVKAKQENSTQWARFGGWWRMFYRKFTVDDAIKRWNHDFSITKSCLEQTKNILVKYEDLISDPSSSLSSLCEKLDIRYEENMIYSEQSFSSIVRKNERWKINNKSSLIREIHKNSYKDPLRKIYIESRLDSYDV